MKPKTTLYLIYRPCLDFEESMVPLLVCPSEEAAERIKAEVCAWCHAKLKSLPKLPRDTDDLRYEELFDLKSDARYKAIESIKRWPRGLSELKELFNAYLNDFEHAPESFLQIMPLPFAK